MKKFSFESKLVERADGLSDGYYNLVPKLQSAYMYRHHHSAETAMLKVMSDVLAYLQPTNRK